MNLTEWARRQGIHPQTAHNWLHAGALPVPAVRVNQRTLLAPRLAALGREQLASMTAVLPALPAVPALRRLEWVWVLDPGHEGSTR